MRLLPEPWVCHTTTDAAVTRLAAWAQPRLRVFRRFSHPVPDQRSGRPQGLLHGRIDGVELVVLRHLLDDLPAAFVLEDDEVAQQLEETASLEDPFQHHLKLRHRTRSILAAGNRSPRFEPFLARPERPDARLHAVRDDERRVDGEQRRDLVLVGLKLLPGGPDSRVLVGRVLELDHRER